MLFLVCDLQHSKLGTDYFSFSLGHETRYRIFLSMLAGVRDLQDTKLGTEYFSLFLVAYRIDNTQIIRLDTKLGTECFSFSLSVSD